MTKTHVTYTSTAGKINDLEKEVLKSINGFAEKTDLKNVEVSAVLIRILNYLNNYDLKKLGK